MFSDKLLSAGLAKQAGFLLVGLTLSAWAYTASAAVIFDQPPLNDGVAYQSNWSGGSQYADNFSFSSEATLKSIQWWGSYLIQGNDDFKVRIFAGVGGPNVSHFAEYNSSVTRTLTLLSDSGGNSVYQYELVLSTNRTLQAGSYYLSVINNNDFSTANDNNPSDWLWLQSSTGDGSTGDGTAWFRQSDGESWVTDVVEGRAGFAFILNGTQQQQPIPEPGILSLFALCALVMTGRQLFQRRHAM